MLPQAIAHLQGACSGKRVDISPGAECTACAGDHKCPDGSVVPDINDVRFHLDTHPGSDRVQACRAIQRHDSDRTDLR